MFGLGRVRVTTSRRGGEAGARGARVGARAGGGEVPGAARTRVATWTLEVNGRPALARAQTYPRGITLDTRRLPDGWHALAAVARDYPATRAGWTGR